ncbi:MAG TPA: hypothetical protein VFP55_08170 [Solirubrobacteraceae bacterium]|nr:hypothetical protein [Solirubrobacteraceae bacterium]
MGRVLSRRPSPSMVVALLALLLATAGTAVAATKLVSGDKLIKKHSLSGNRLRNHTLTGKQINLAALGQVPLAAQAARAAQANGLSVLPSGQSESGIFSAGGANSSGAGGWLGYGLTYPRPLASPIPDSHIIDVQSGTSALHCPGFGRADPGYLCLYDTINYGVDPAYMYSTDSGDLQQSPSIGVVIYWPVTLADPYAGGEWTVTAP